ncbi:MAG: flavin reductase family protein [Vallitalea sp.]|jgi:flavin reductase (DIM6/NTAB) family NADH-FMN oxidoreductase RutF|nr:flavin reductase family protein [Vallitalea sp.]
MEKKQVIAKSSIQPLPNVLVSCRGKDGKDNALAVGYCTNCSYDPPMVMVGIVPSRHSYQMIKDTKCFVVNLATKDFKKEFNYLGSVSGKDEDKLAKMNIKTANGSKVNAPILVDCPVNIECTVVDSIMTGSHEMFVGKIENIQIDESVNIKNGKLDLSNFELL